MSPIARMDIAVRTWVASLMMALDALAKPDVA